MHAVHSPASLTAAVARGFIRAARGMSTRSVAASGSLVYEGARARDEYLHFHFGEQFDTTVASAGIEHTLGFVGRLAEECVATAQQATPAGEEANLEGMRVLDVGCAVGGASFHLSRSFGEVVGVDFSHQFVDAAQQMQADGAAEYEVHGEGEVMVRRECTVPDGAHSERITFQQGDACNLPVEQLGQFDVVLAANLLCRLPSPRAFLRCMTDMVKPNGALVLVSPYSWLEEYTAKDEWLGGRQDTVTGEAIQSRDAVAAELAASFDKESNKDMPFLIREHPRKFQLGVSDCVVWRRKQEPNGA